MLVVDTKLTISVNVLQTIVRRLNICGLTNKKNTFLLFQASFHRTDQSHFSGDFSRIFQACTNDDLFLVVVKLLQ